MKFHSMANVHVYNLRDTAVYLSPVLSRDGRLDVILDLVDPF